MKQEAEFIRKTRFVLEPHRYKVLWGGRNGVKSWTFAQALIIRGVQQPTRWLCCREVQHSIKESVHLLLSDTIQRLGLSAHYEILESSIRGRNGTHIALAGLKNTENLKSYESYDGAWVEEAQAVSKDSWNKLLPTIRKQGSEIWIGFNPQLATDETYQRWVINPPPGAVVVKTGWEDNPWLTDTSKAEIEHMRRVDPVAFAHVYGGECVNAVEGAIFGAEMRAAREQGRICQVPYTRARPVDTVWDLGYGDLTAIWFVQAYDGWFHFVDYEEGDGMTIHEWLTVLQNKRYVYGTDWLPHDAVDAIIHHRMAGDKTMSVEMLMRQAGRRVRIVPKLHVHDRINAGRTIFPQCRFDESRCLAGIQALEQYQWGPINDLGIRQKQPLHNRASHGSDAFTEAGVCIKQPIAELQPQVVAPRAVPRYAPFG